MKLKNMRITITTNGDGVGAGYGDAVFGQLYAVQLIDGSFVDGVGITITCEHEDISRPILTKANFDIDSTYYPRELVHAVADGAALTGTSGGDRVMPVILGRPKVAIASGGATKVGGVILYYFE